jgi:Ca-activated chloride channel homolog
MSGALKPILVAALMLLVLPAMGQADRHDVRAGNRKFRKDKFKEAEIDYRKAVLKDSTSMKAQYNLASALYRQEDYEGAQKALSAVDSEGAPAQYHYNAGDVALQRKDYASAVKSFREALLQDPNDLDAKENYIYAKKMLENQQGQGGGGGQDQNNQDQNRNQDNQDQNQNQNDQDQNNNQDNQPQQQPQDDGGQQDQQAQQGISPQQAQQMLKAVQAKEKETQDKVKKEKAALLKSKQKEKNW